MHFPKFFLLQVLFPRQILKAHYIPDTNTDVEDKPLVNLLGKISHRAHMVKKIDDRKLRK